MRGATFGPFGYFVLVLAFVLTGGRFAWAQPLEPVSLEMFLAQRFGKSDPPWELEKLCPVTTNVVAARVFREYGAMFAAADSITLPETCLYEGEPEVQRFQKKLETKLVLSGGIWIDLQGPAAEAMRKAIEEAAGRNLSIRPLDGRIAGSRTYGDTLMLWNGRFFSALEYWTRRGRLTQQDRDSISRLDLRRRIEQIMEWEANGIYFSTDRSRSIFSSTAPPGTSQHLSKIAFDVAEFGRPEVREILNRNGWYQTVVGDPPHFTFLGIAEADLPSRGLQLVVKGSYFYWVPKLSQPTISR
jgi:hypothetical protein